MTRSPIALLAAIPLFVAASSAQAQEPGPDREARISIGVARNDRLDRAVSPMRFGGNGVSANIGYRTVGDRFDIGLSALGKFEALAPTTGTSQEFATTGELKLSMLPSSRGRDRAFSFGAEADLNAVVVAHRYPDPAQRRTTNLFATGTVGPLVSFRHKVGDGGLAEARLSTPLLGVVAHPYSALRGGRTIDTHFATIASLQGANAVLSYTPAVTRKFGLVYEYRLSALRYDGVLPVRSLSQSFSIGFVRRGFGLWR